jgi:hypothetical protein
MLHSLYMSGLVPWAHGRAPVSTSLVPYQQSPAMPVTVAPPSVLEWWRQLRDESTPEVASPVESAIVALRQNGEGAAIGALLALIDTDFGGLDFAGRVPLDWVGSAFFNIMSVSAGGNPTGLALDYRAMGQSCTTIAMYRMVHKWRDAKKGIPRNIPQTSGDPVLAAGKSKF